jgi:ergothioneine biosynthesis protein EgtB
MSALRPMDAVPSPRSGSCRLDPRAVRSLTDDLAAPLSAEDQTVQSMPDVSPTKWHRAHTTWFFETFVLGPHAEGYRVHDEEFAYLFNSYYETVGARHPRVERGLVSRPSADQVGAYRRHVDDALFELLDATTTPELEDLMQLGLHHEQQHQELLVMDITHVLSRHPFDPPYRPRRAAAQPGATRPLQWNRYSTSTVQIGHDGEGFAFDNESPRHDALVHAFEIADRLVTCGEWIDFIDDGGYRRPELWMSDGWATVGAQGWDSPLYWRAQDGTWTVFGTDGRRVVDAASPVANVSWYEADAFARWSGARLPTEAEWEVAAGDPPPGAHLRLDDLGPSPATRSADPQQHYGELWQWTESAYRPYRGYRPPSGAIGEYNGKFMVNQQVLRGSSFATPEGHARRTYRNFFPAGARWAFSGVRLARDA